MNSSFRYIEPSFFAGLFDDPVLILRLKPIGRRFLVDCGNVAHLAKRLFKSIDSIFVSHAHMDHFAGIDTVVRHVLVSRKTIDLFGPAGIAEHLHNKMRGYRWNLVEAFYCRFKIHEISDGRLNTFVLSGPDGFSLEREGSTALRSHLICENRFVRTEAVVCDHIIPSLAFAFKERSNFSVDIKKIETEGLVPGRWLGDLKNRLMSGGRPNSSPLRVPFVADGGVKEREVQDELSFYESIKLERKLSSVGYVTDIGFTAGNLERLRAIMGGVTLLVCECTFLKEQKKKARKSYHLCTDDVNELMRTVRPRFLLPIHLSKSNKAKTDQLYRELQPPPGCSVIRLPGRVSAEPLMHIRN